MDYKEKLTLAHGLEALGPEGVIKELKATLRSHKRDARVLDMLLELYHVPADEWETWLDEVKVYAAQRNNNRLAHMTRRWTAALWSDALVVAGFIVLALGLLAFEFYVKGNAPVPGSVPAQIFTLLCRSVLMFATGFGLSEAFAHGRKVGLFERLFERFGRGNVFIVLLFVCSLFTLRGGVVYLPWSLHSLPWNIALLALGICASRISLSPANRSF